MPRVDYSNVDVNKLSGAELKAAYKQLAKRADQRLVRLETLERNANIAYKLDNARKRLEKTTSAKVRNKLTKEISELESEVKKNKISKDTRYFRGVTEYAYKMAMSDVKHWSGEGANRFNRDMPKTEEGLRGKINDIKRFMNSETSTRTDIRQVYKNRLQTLKDNFGFAKDLTWQDLTKFFSEKANAYWDENVPDSNQKIRVIAKMSNYKSFKDFSDDIKETVKNNKTISDDEVLTDVLLDIAKNDGAKLKRRDILK